MPDSLPYDEKQLLQLVSKGDENAFAFIVNRYSSKIYAHLLAYLKRPVIAEEITQDIMLTIWNKRADILNVQNFSGWLFTVTKNRAYTAFRDMLEHVQLPENDQIEAQLQNPLQSLEYRDLTERLVKKINELPPRRQRVFKMSRIEGKSYDEIASVLGISKSAVNQHIVEALGFLRTFLFDEIRLLVFVLTSSLIF